MSTLVAISDELSLTIGEVECTTEVTCCYLAAAAVGEIGLGKIM